MPTILQNSYIGQTIHYYANLEDQCHSAVIAENYMADDQTGIPVTADIIQLDTVDDLGLIVPTRHNAVDYDDTITIEGTWHIPCPRQMS